MTLQMSEPDDLAAAPSLRRFFQEAVAPRGWLAWIVLLLVVLRPASMYLDTAIEMRDASQAARLHHTFGDSQYFDVLSMVGSFDFGEHAVLEHRGEGFMAFPIYPFLIVAPLWKLLGSAGIYVAVGITLWLAVVAARVMFRAMGLSSTFALLTAALLVIVPWNQYIVFRDAPLLNLWDPRIGRPMGTMPQLLAALACLAMLARSERHRRSIGVWCLISAFTLLTLQGDLHSGLTLAWIAGLAWIACAVERVRRGDVTRLLTATGAAVLVGAVVLIPFIVARVREHPDSARHLGVIPLSRLHPFVDLKAAPYVFIGIAGSGIAAAIAWLHWRRREVRDAEHPYSVARLVPVVLTLAYFALPVSIIVLGRGAQLFHFRDTLRYLVTISLFYSLGMVVQLALDASGKLPLAERLAVLRRRPAIIATLFLLLPVLSIVYPVVARDLSPRPRGESTAPPGWRASFTALTNHLGSDHQRDSLVMATFDSNVYPIWSGLLAKHAYMSDILTTTLPDAITERRLAEVCKLVGMSRERYRDYLTGAWDPKSPVNEALFYRLGQGKYSATRNWTLDPIETYTPEDQKKIRSVPRDAAWNLVLSIPEQERLLAIYDAVDTSALSGRLDVIVLRDVEFNAGLRPPEAMFERTFGDALYEVWTRRR